MAAFVLSRLLRDSTGRHDLGVLSYAEFKCVTFALLGHFCCSRNACVSKVRTVHGVTEAALHTITVCAYTLLYSKDLSIFEGGLLPYTHLRPFSWPRTRY